MGACRGTGHTYITYDLALLDTGSGLDSFGETAKVQVSGGIYAVVAYLYHIAGTALAPASG